MGHFVATLPPNRAIHSYVAGQTVHRQMYGKPRSRGHSQGRMRRFALPPPASRRPCCRRSSRDRIAPVEGIRDMNATMVGGVSVRRPSKSTPHSGTALPRRGRPPNIFYRASGFASSDAPFIVGMTGHHRLRTETCRHRTMSPGKSIRERS